MRGTHGTRELLVELLIGSDPRARDAARVIDQQHVWKEAVEHAAAWRVTPRLSSQIARLDVTLPEKQAFELRRSVISAYSRSAFLAAKGMAAIHHLQAAGVRVAAFKGLASMARLYDGPKERIIKDVDLLVSEDDLEKAVNALEAIGYQRHIDAGLDQYAAFVANSPAFAGNKSITLRSAGGSEIDLHWGVGKGFETPGILERSETGGTLGQKFPMVSAEDGLLLTARHAARENLAIEETCRDLIDLKLGFAYLARDGGLKRVSARGSAAGMTPLLVAVAGILGRYDSNPNAAGFFAANTSEQDRRAGGRLIELFEIQLVEGPLGKDLLYLAHRAPARQIVSGLAKDAREYRRFMRVFETETMGQPLSWRKRLWNLAGSVCRLGTRRFRSLRELARVKYD